MTRTLILMRHAKSSWGGPAVDDHDRPLNARGNRDAPRIGRWLAENDLVPDHAHCSTARRAQETLEGLGHTTPTTLMPDLYMASPAMLLKTIRAATAPRIIVVAHNPGIGAFGHQIVKAPPAHPRFHDTPTAATLVVEFDTDDWSKIEAGSGSVRAFITPHDLPE